MENGKRDMSQVVGRLNVIRSPKKLDLTRASLSPVLLNFLFPSFIISIGRVFVKVKQKKKWQEQSKQQESQPVERHQEGKQPVESHLNSAL